jgi:hypothetical protein
MHYSIPQGLKLSVYDMVGMNKDGLKLRIQPH